MISTKEISKISTRKAFTKNFILCAVLICLLCGCGKDVQTKSGNTQENGSREISDKEKEEKNTETDSATIQQNTAKNLFYKTGDLRFLCAVQKMDIII